MAITARQFSSEDDYAQMQRLATKLYRLVGPFVDGTPGDLDWWRYPHDGEGGIRNARLWFDEGEQLVAFAWLLDDELNIFVHPEQALLYEETLIWAEAQRLQTGANGGEALSLTAWAFEHEHSKQAVLRARGYTPSDHVYCQRSRRLDTALPVPPLPAGYRIDHISDDLVESRAAAQQDAFKSKNMTAERYRRLKQAPNYRTDFDLVVIDPTGEVAAFTIVWFDPINRVGTFEPVGTRHAQQRRGLARALLIDGMNRLRDIGADTALVVSEEGNDASNKFYDALGMVVVGRDVGWRKIMEQGANGRVSLCSNDT